MPSDTKRINAIPVIIILLISFLAGLFGVLYVADYSRRMSDDIISMSCETNCYELERTLTSVSNAVNLIAGNISYEVENPSKIQDFRYQKELNRQITNQFKSSISKTSGICNAYFRYDPELSGSDTSGFFLQITNGVFTSLNPTPINKYDSSDIEHVGWFYIPKQRSVGCWMEPYMNSNVNTLMISYVVPVKVKGTFIGVLGADLDMTEIVSSIDSMEAPNGGHYFITDHSGRILNNYSYIENEKKIKITKHLSNEMYFGVELPEKYRNSVQSTVVYKVVVLIFVLMLGTIFSYLLYLFQKYSRVPNEEKFITERMLSIIFGATTIFIFILQVVFFAVRYIHYQLPPSLKDKPLNYFEKTYVVAFDKDAMPYSVDDSNDVLGFEIELLNNIANRLGFNVVYEGSDWKTAYQRVVSGEADILLGCEVDYKSNEDDKLIRTHSYMDDIFSIVGTYSVSGLSDFSGKKIAYLAGENIPSIAGVKYESLYYENYKSLLDAVESGECDYGFLRENSFDLYLSRFGYIDLHKVYNFMNSSIGLALNEKHKSILNNINVEINNIRNDGKLDRLYRKWIRDYKGNYSVLDIFNADKQFFIISTVILMLGIISSLFLVFKSKNEEGALISKNLWLQLEALSRNYVSMYLLDMKNDTFQEYKSRKYIRNTVGDGDKQADARRLMPEAIKQTVCEENLNEMLAFTDLNTIQERIKGKSMLEIEFQGKYSGWCRGKFIALNIDSSDDSRYIIWAVETIDKEKKREMELRYKSEIDMLTGINNRGSGEARIQELMNSGKNGMFVLFDVDKFKSVNDNYGHAVGDKVLIEIARCMRYSFRDNDVVVRFGGDEFAAYAVGALSKPSAQMILDRLFEQIDKIYIPELCGKKISVSVGVTFFAEDSELTFDEIYRQADECAYSSKAVNGNFYTFFSD